MVAALAVPIERARVWVPDYVDVVPFAPGRTLGALVAVTYEEGSTLTYSELVVACATVRSGSRVGGWISHIWVDDEQSVSGGRSIWKLPKEIAAFGLDRRADGTQRFEARADGATLVRVAAARPRVAVRTPLAVPVPMISAEDGSGFFTLGRAALAGGLARVSVQVPPGSPRSALGLKAAPVGVAGRARLVMDAPRPVGRAASSPE